MPVPDILKDVGILWGKYHISSDMNEVRIALDGEEKDCTTFASGGWREYTQGLRGVSWDVKGFHNTSTDGELFAALGGTAVPISVTHTLPITANDISLTQLTVEANYTQGNTLGELVACSLRYGGQGAFLKGKCLEAAVAVSSSGNSAGLQLGAATSTQTVYAALHVTDLDDPLDVVVASDADNTFGSAVNRITFDQMTEPGWQLKSLAGPVTDDWWRITRTLGGGTATYYVFLIIQ